MTAISQFLWDGSLDASSVLFVTASAGIGLLIWSVSAASRNKKTKPWNTVPGWLPIVGHFHHVGGTPWMGQVLERWAKLHSDAAGCYEMDLMGVRYMVVCRPDRAMEILKQRPYHVQRDPGIREASDSTGAKGVFSAEGALWKEEKKLLAAALNKANVNDWLVSLRLNANRLVQKWDRDMGAAGETCINNQPISLDVGRMTADAVAKVMLDRDFDFLNNPDSEMAHNVFTGFRGWILRALSPIWYWRIPVIGQDLDGYGKYFRYLGHVFDNVVDDFECQRKKTKQQDDNAITKMFLGKLYDVMEREKSSLSRQRVVGNIYTAFVAGIDTTSKTLISTLYVLAQDQDLQQELREHVQDFDMDANNNNNDTMTLQDLNAQLPMLKSFLHEIHRCYAVPFIMLRVAEEIPFCGTTLPAGQDVLLLGRYMSMKPDAPDVPLGPDNISPTEFSHRRYLVEEKNDSSGNNDGAGQKKWTCPGPSDKGTGFLNFGHGVRKCPGRLYTEALSYYALIAILQNFEFELAPNHPPVNIIFDSVMTPDTHIQLKLTKLHVPASS